MNQPWQRTTHSAEETIQLGLEIAETLKPGAVLCLFGDLAAGKTTLVKGIAHGLSGIAMDEVNSPTFTYLNIYSGTKPTTVYHFDLYRLSDAASFLGMGFEEMFFLGGVCCIEWSERIEELLPPHRIHVYMKHRETNLRIVEVNYV